MGALGLVSAAGSPVAEQQVLMQFWVQGKLTVSLIQAPSSVGSPND